MAVGTIAGKNSDELLVDLKCERCGLKDLFKRILHRLILDVASDTVRSHLIMRER